MSGDAKNRFEKWIEQKRIPDNIKKYLEKTKYDTMDMLPYLSIQAINESSLTENDQQILIKTLNLTIDSAEESEEEEKEIKQKRSQLRWKEFGFARHFSKWNKSFLPVELFSRDGYWYWNSAAKSLTYGSERVIDIWGGFDNEKPGWIMSPPVLLPSKLGAFKFTFNLRLFPDNDDKLPKLQMLLLNDGYNKNICQFNKFPLKLRAKFRFISFSDGMKIGEKMENICEFTELHESKYLNIPGNVLQLKKPPIISIHVLEI